jgi:hypothetical protein
MTASEFWFMIKSFLVGYYNVAPCNWDGIHWVILILFLSTFKPAMVNNRNKGD